jgi:hypothetical protein
LSNLLSESGGRHCGGSRGEGVVRVCVRGSRHVSVKVI